MTNKTIQQAKRAVGAAAAQLVQDGMTVGIGTGTTAAYFIEALIERCRAGLSITAIPTSQASAQQLQRGGLTVKEIDSVPAIDLVIDGADEIDPNRCLIKGGGGALLREKIVAVNASEMVVMVDETKLVDRLGTFGLPLEILPFGHTHTLKRLREHGYQPTLRLRRASEPYVTDNGNFLADLRFERPIEDPRRVDDELQHITGVLETGLFLGLAKRVLIGRIDGHVDVEA